MRFANLTKKAALLAVSAVVAGATFGGCSSPEPSPASSPGTQSAGQQSGTGGTQISAPEFQGPFAEEFRDAYQDASTDLGRQILEDGVITAAEFAEVEAIMIACLLENGVEVQGGLVGDGSGGVGYEAQNLREISQEEDGEIETSCEQASDAVKIGLLYFGMKDNPENRNQGEIMAECLVYKQVVPRGYSGEDWERDMMSQEHSDPVNMSAEELKRFEAEQECFADPFAR